MKTAAASMCCAALAMACAYFFPGVAADMEASCATEECNLADTHGSQATVLLQRTTARSEISSATLGGRSVDGLSSETLKPSQTLKPKTSLKHKSVSKDRKEESTRVEEKESAEISLDPVIRRAIMRLGSEDEHMKDSKTTEQWDLKERSFVTSVLADTLADKTDKLLGEKTDNLLTRSVKTKALSSYMVKASMYHTMLDAIAGTDLGPGTTVGLDEEGYQKVAQLNDHQQMEFFIRRLVSQMGLRVVDQGGLHGFVPFFFGEEHTQTYEDLTREVNKAGHDDKVWVTDHASGASAPLNQDGYENVVALANNREMSEFVQRVASDLGLTVTDEGGLSGVAEWHSGDKDQQTFKDLQGELINASRTNHMENGTLMNGTWVNKSHPCPDTGHPSEDAINKLQNSTRWANITNTTQEHQPAHLHKKSKAKPANKTVYVSEDVKRAQPKKSEKKAEKSTGDKTEDAPSKKSAKKAATSGEDTEAEKSTGDKSEDAKPAPSKKSEKKAADESGEDTEAAPSEKSEEKAAADAESVEKLTSGEDTEALKPHLSKMSNLTAVADSESEEKAANSGSEEKVADSESEEKVANSGSEEKVADSESEEKVANSGSEEKVADSESEEKVANSGSEEKVADSGSEEEVANSNETAEVTKKVQKSNETAEGAKKVQTSRANESSF